MGENDVIRRRLLSGAGALSVGWVLAGCQRSSQDPGADGDTREVSRRRHLTHPGPPQQVAVLNAAIAPALLQLGFAPSASPDTLDEQFLDRYATMVDPAIDLGAIERLGDEGELDLELLAAASPDLILAVDFVDPSIYDCAASIAPVVMIEWGGNGQWRRRLLAYADLVGRNDEATAIEGTYEQTIRRTPEKLRSHMLAAIRGGADGFRIDNGPEAFPGSIARDAGR